MALWAYMGIESAAVSAGVIENPKRNIPLATLIGLGLAAVVYVLSSTVIMGIIPNAALQTLHAPFAEAARLVMGTWGMAIVAVCAILKSVGSSAAGCCWSDNPQRRRRPTACSRPCSAGSIATASQAWA